MVFEYVQKLRGSEFMAIKENPILSPPAHPGLALTGLPWWFPKKCYDFTP
jgi:hypothetical protein